MGVDQPLVKLNGILYRHVDTIPFLNRLMLAKRVVTIIYVTKYVY